MWPLILLAAVGYGYYYWMTHEQKTSPNVVLKGEVQYAREPSLDEKQQLEVAMASYAASEPEPLTEGPLAGGAVILLTKQATASEANIAATIAAVQKAGPLIKAKDMNDMRALLAVEQIDALMSKNVIAHQGWLDYPAQVRLYVAPTAVALRAAKAPSAYAILE